MKMEELQNKYPEVFRKIGAISYNFNRIEGNMIGALSSFFIHSNPQSERNFIFSDALSDKDVFPTFENKRQLLIKTINAMSIVAEENNVSFEKEKWLQLCESIRKLQEMRNNLLHHNLVFLPHGKVGYNVRKSYRELLEDTRVGKKGSSKTIEIDLDDEVKKSNEMTEESLKLITEFSVDSLNILISIGDLSFEKET